MKNRNYNFKTNNSRLSRALSLIGNLFFCVCVVIGVALIMFSSVTEECVVVGSSMSPTLNKDAKNGSDVVYVNKYKREFVFGDIIVINMNESDHIIKRVIGVPGDIIDIVYVELQNGMNVVYNNFHGYLKDTYSELFNEDNKLVVPENQIFALGDNRHDSKDSTFYGTFYKEDVMGTVELTRFATDSEFGFYLDYIMQGKFFETIANCF